MTGASAQRFTHARHLLGSQARVERVVARHEAARAVRPPAALDAAHRNRHGRLRGDEHGRVQDAVLLGAHELFAVEQEDGPSRPVVESQRGDRAALIDLLDRHLVARLGQREPVGLGTRRREKRNHSQRPVAHGSADTDGFEQLLERGRFVDSRHRSLLLWGSSQRIE